MTVLPDWEIRNHFPALVNPFDIKQVQPASYDVRLGDTFRVFVAHRTAMVDLADLETSGAGLTEEKRIKPGDSFVLHPDQFVLGRTVERVILPANVAARLEGKSSLARLGLIVHATGGFLDPGFEGTITLEMKNLLPVPIRLHHGQKIGQVSFMYLSEGGAEHPYGSHPDLQSRYQGQEAATASRFTT